MAIKSKNTDGGSSLRSRLQILIPSAIVLVGVAVSALYADLQQQRLSREAARNAVEENLGLIRTKLEANINANIKLLQGMVAVIGTEPYVTQRRFEALASSLLSTPSQIGNIAAAPNLITSFVHPYEDNKSFIGHWILPPPNGEEEARQLRDEGRTIISGPLPLKNGAMGLIITLPVKMTNDEGNRVFWGGLAGVVDVARLYDDSGLRAPDLPLAITITDDSQKTGSRAVIYGDSHILTDDPVTMTVDFGNEKWSISAVPKGGWHAMSRPDILIRGMIAAMSALIAGSVIWVAGLMRERQRNYAALRQREEQLTAVSHRLGLALDASRIGIWELDLASGQITWDERMYQIYGVNRDVAACYDVWKSCVHPDDLAASDEALAKAIEKDTLYETQFRIIRDGGEICHIRTVGAISRDEKGPVSVLGVNWDVSADINLQENLRKAQRETAQRNEELETARQRMEYNSLHDALTGLPNRRYLDQRLEALVAGADRPGGRLTVLHMDLDRFKEINDTLGHGAGDAILRHVAQELQSMVGECDFVARIGGDEFVIVCQGCDLSEGYEAMGSNLISAVNRPIVYNGHECRVGASIGIADRIEPELTAEQLLVNADIALYEAKRRGRNRVERFNDQLRARTINIKRTADAILRSLGDDDFIAWYQPQFDARTLAINGVEALARWRHPEKGILAPNAFLETAENLNVVSQIDASILDQALEQLAHWKTEGLGIEHVSVNISAQRLFEDKLLDHLTRLDFKPGSLSFELLESISFDDKADAVAESLERIRTQGIAIEIDDFGTGYASILSLIKLSPSRLKIDRQLVAPIVNSPAQRKLISSIVDIGRSYGIGIVAEGVETMEHAAILRDLGCQTLQGYALARPMSPDSFIDFARKHALQREDLLQRSA
ncbi:PAS domain S-box-containing protein/diguanylate cyclase (GGDEF) domain-containing protein [Rhizobium sp. RU33A]|uniref:bifunctional diguanylate cyclase/phosphodiesterase n=1 Tax=Rhizobium sp. RU33A TaxID=1907413 RepID=UPI000956F626|nr:EAL domain-containing protein [Rhizobium sp. RU33A]SIQ30035.1 PAS domain S-box-containing protein/diguanylate cyclase (GGDEF) domain-containing protein [Rhizobium sp. RU33A]